MTARLPVPNQTAAPPCEGGSPLQGAARPGHRAHKRSPWLLECGVLSGQGSGVPDYSSTGPHEPGVPESSGNEGLTRSCSLWSSRHTARIPSSHPRMPSVSPDQNHPWNPRHLPVEHFPPWGSPFPRPFKFDLNVVQPRFPNLIHSRRLFENRTLFFSIRNNVN